jgi:hypothetical protein
MNPKLSGKILVALSFLYGVVIALLGAFGSSQVGVVAGVGAIILGALWFARALFTRDSSNDPS